MCRTRLALLAAGLVSNGCAKQPCRGLELAVSAETTESRAERMVALTTLASVSRPRGQLLHLQGLHASGVLCVDPGRNRIVLRAHDRGGRVVQIGETTVEAMPGAPDLEFGLRAEPGETPFRVRLGLTKQVPVARGQVA